MTDIKELVQELEYANYHCTSNKGKKAINDAIETINRLQADYDGLNERFNDLLDEVVFTPNRIKHTKADAIKEFAERLKEKQQTFTGDEYFYKFIYLIEIDNLVKEMVGEG